MAISVLKGPKAIENFDEVVNKLSDKMDVLYQQLVYDLNTDVRKWFTIALRWVIYSTEEVTEELIADEIENRYSVGRGSNSRVDRHQEDSNVERPSIEILKKQARNLLRFDSERKVHLMHPTMRDWIEREGEQEERKQRDDASRCPTCAKDIFREGPVFPATKKHGVLFMASYIMTVLNNENFRRRYISHRKSNGRFRYELLSWHYHVRLAEENWPKNERQSGRYAEDWTRLYKDIDRFMDPGSRDFRTWFRRAYRGHIRKDSNTRLYYASFFGLQGTIEKNMPENKPEAWFNPLRAVCLGRGCFVGLHFIVDQLILLKGQSVSSLDGSQQEGGLSQELNERGSSWYATPIMILIDHNAPVADVEFLYSKGAAIDQKSESGSSSLHYAVRM